ncbi:MAG: SAM-dependent methyltransferase [Burkholderiales bacterium]|nr:SAM-dependent methyltransferase [Burkholderiales bacterium]
MSAALSPGTLYLLPTGLGASSLPDVLPLHVLSIAGRLARFIAENPKSARAFLKQAGYPRPLSEAVITTLDKNTPAEAIPGLLEPLLQGCDVGLLSEAGCPAIADPGALLVRAAHRAGIIVMPLVGPSSILLALMASGLNGQRFAFHGYLPVENAARAGRLRELERRSRQDDATQVFIETPYRNDAMLQALLDSCAPDTLLCVATDLTQPSGQVRTQRIADWRRKPPSIDRRPSVFLVYAGA